ncbi:MAG: WbqC family protein [Alphaproteobacteria bacterium]|nr:WbqC family protein [Alphaproteobacteria bacterium]
MTSAALAIPPAQPAVKRVAIIQSNYIPWKGYFDIIGAVDLFILLDDAQFTRRDWRNRNRIKTPAGLQWLSIPVVSKGRYTEPIDAIAIAEPWAEAHWRSLEVNYRRAACFAAIEGELRALYEEAAQQRLLSAINFGLLRGICRLLGIATPIRRSREFAPEGAKTDRLLSICRSAGATEYLSGPAARAYLEIDKFEAAGIAVRWMDYAGYPEYPQLFGPFEHGVSILDLLFNTGRDAPRYMKGFAW